MCLVQRVRLPHLYQVEFNSMYLFRLRHAYKSRVNKSLETLHHRKIGRFCRICELGIARVQNLMFSDAMSFCVVSLRSAY